MLPVWLDMDTTHMKIQRKNRRSLVWWQLYVPARLGYSDQLYACPDAAVKVFVNMISIYNQLTLRKTDYPL